MKYVEAVLKNEKFLECIHQISELEKSRMYCKHDFTHLLDVCRIAHLINLENHLGMDKEQLYLCGLLHDIGRGEEYLTGANHADAGVKIATEILSQIQCPPHLRQAVLHEIGNHRKKPTDMTVVTRENLFYLADKRSRNCFMCEANMTCNWPNDKKNKTIVY